MLSDRFFFRACFALVLYLIIVRSNRYERLRKLMKQYPTRETFKLMTVSRAYEIRLELATQEFPTTFSNAIFFALFKTYGIPSISKLLVQTGQLASQETSSKRIADTGVLLTELVYHHPVDIRAVQAIARMNYIHSGYQKAGKISDEDMLYTLSLFALEGPRWVERFEWRCLQPVELCAIGTYWQYIAARMKIPSDRLLNTKLKDGLDFLERLADWSLSYEARAMRFARTNRTMAMGTLDIGLYNVPWYFHGVYTSLVSAILEPRVRVAMGFPEPPAWATALLTDVVAVRRFTLRYLCLPRPHWWRKRFCNEKPNVHGKYNATEALSLPWYIKPTLNARWGPTACYMRIMGRKLPGDDGDKYEPQGYTILEVGPDKLKGKGQAEMAAFCESIRADQKLRCPFGF